MEEIGVRYKPAVASGAPLEFYIVANMCFKVSCDAVSSSLGTVYPAPCVSLQHQHAATQHAWNASGDEDERAWTTAHILQTMAIAANILASKVCHVQLSLNMFMFPRYATSQHTYSLGCLHCCPRLMNNSRQMNLFAGLRGVSMQHNYVYRFITPQGFIRRPSCLQRLRMSHLWVCPCW